MRVTPLPITQCGSMLKAATAKATARLIPRHSTPELALAAWECLHAVREALRPLYEPQLQQV